MLEGKSPISKVYADELVTAFIPLDPFTIGHTLVIPNKHSQSIIEINEKTLMHMMKIAHKIANSITHSKYKCEGVNLWLSDGEQAGQDVMHTHLHVFPRYKGDSFSVTFHSDKEQSNRKFLDEVAEEIKAHLQSAL